MPLSGYFQSPKTIDKIVANYFSRKGFQLMALPSLELNSLLNQLGQVGKGLSDLGAAEGAAGNLSICFREPLDVTVLFPKTQIVELPIPVPDLAGATLIVTGSGRRLRAIIEHLLRTSLVSLWKPAGEQEGCLLRRIAHSNG